MNIRWLVAALAGLALQSCEETKTTQSEQRGTNDETSSFVLSDGRKASNATVTVYSAGKVDSMPRIVTYTNANGNVDLKDLPRGYYSLMVTDKSGSASFVDSVYSDGLTVNLPSDTLRPTGSIKGRIKVQAQDDPKIAWVALVGAGFFRTIDNDSGAFLLTGVPAGNYTLVSRTDLSVYTSTFRAATVKSDSVSDVGAIELVYTGLPVVTGIVGKWDSLGGIVDLKWDAATSPKVKGYRVYRGTSVDAFDEVYLGTVDSGVTRYVDTVFPPFQWGMPSKGLAVDSGNARYFVRAVGQKGEEGDRWNSWSATLRSPFLVAQLPASWTKVSTALPAGVTRLDTVSGAMVGLGRDKDGRDVVWKSTDGGQVWSLLVTRSASPIASMGLSSAVSHQGALRWVEAVSSGRKTVFPAPMIAQSLLDTLRIFRMDAGGRLDSTTIAAADDSVNQAQLVVDSAGLVLVEGPRKLNEFLFDFFFSPTHRRLEGSGGEWIEGSWAIWVESSWDVLNRTLRTPFRTVSVTGRSRILPDGSLGSLLDLDSLRLRATGRLAYSRPDAPKDVHVVRGGPADLTSIVWFERKIFVLGQGAIWNVTLP
ncbi:MAG: hypothetical protein IPK50_00740 [Fibrobacterota bacterium]|nr:hypothetical protein [Fibrobacterota bacterium]QQS05441.1 MAG: hypothetical protein IPK50_00740 [Fibrobacterota bacterium]